jgi:hypothetical protein
VGEGWVRDLAGRGSGRGGGDVEVGVVFAMAVGRAVTTGSGWRAMVGEAEGVGGFGVVGSVGAFGLRVTSGRRAHPPAPSLREGEPGSFVSDDGAPWRGSSRAEVVVPVSTRVARTLRGGVPFRARRSAVAARRFSTRLEVSSVWERAFKASARRAWRRRPDTSRYARHQVWMCSAAAQAVSSAKSRPDLSARAWRVSWAEAKRLKRAWSAGERRGRVGEWEMGAGLAIRCIVRCLIGLSIGKCQEVRHLSERWSPFRVLLSARICSDWLLRVAVFVGNL